MNCALGAYCLVFILRLIVRLTKIIFLIARLIANKNFNRTAALIICQKIRRYRRYNQQRQLAIGHYDAVSTFHDDDFCEACLLMLCTGSLELTTENCR